jgi:hypothetical protein
VRDVKRLYLSGMPPELDLGRGVKSNSSISKGNALKAGFITEACYNLVYLEMAACRLTALPEDLSKLVPNLRVLNLNYNFIEDPRPLEGLTRLRKLTMIGSRLKGTKPLIRVLQRMPEVEMLDFRYVGDSSCQFNAEEEVTMRVGLGERSLTGQLSEERSRVMCSIWTIGR